MDIPPVTIDGINWVFGVAGTPNPICRKHHLPLYYFRPWDMQLECAECAEPLLLSRRICDEQAYVKDKINSKELKKIKFINLDDEALPIAEVKLKSKNNKYFATGLLIQSKVGLRLVIYAGERGKTEKTQIFVEPEIKRVAFDQKDLHPSEVFVKFEGIFADGTVINMKKINE